MPTVIHELADAFLRRKQAMSEGKRAKSVLPGSDYFMPKSAKQDLNNRLSVFEQGGLPELLKQGASEMYHNPIVNTALGAMPVAGEAMLAGDIADEWKQGNYKTAAALAVLGLAPGGAAGAKAIKQLKKIPEGPRAQALREAEEYGQKLLGLPPGNTPMDRAIAGGFQPTYHGSKTPELVNETGYLIPGGRAGSQRSGDAYGVGVYSTTSPTEASAPVYTGETGAVYPLMIQRENFLNTSNLSAMDKEKLTKFAEESLLPSDKARFEAGIKQKTFAPEETSAAKEFFENQQKNAEQFGSGYDRTKPWIDKDKSGNFVINYTDFDAPISINSKEEAEKLLSAVGYDAVPSMGYSGHTLEKVGGKKWDITNDPGVLRSQFAAFDPRYFGKPGLMLGVGAGVPTTGLSVFEFPEREK